MKRKKIHCNNIPIDADLMRSLSIEERAVIITRLSELALADFDPGTISNLRLSDLTDEGLYVFGALCERMLKEYGKQIQKSTVNRNIAINAKRKQSGKYPADRWFVRPTHHVIAEYCRLTGKWIEIFQFMDFWDDINWTKDDIKILDWISEVDHKYKINTESGIYYDEDQYLYMMTELKKMDFLKFYE